MGKQTKVFVLIKGLDVGGAEQLLATSVCRTNRKEFDYEVGYLVPSQNTLVSKLEQHGIPVFCLGQKRFYDPRVIYRLAKLLRSRGVDVLHIHLPYAGIIGRIAGKLAGVKVIVYSEHTPVDRYHPLTRVVSRLTYRWNDAVVAVSEQVQRSVEANYRVPRDFNIRTIHNGIDCLAVSGSDHGLANRAEVRKEFGIPAGHSLVIHVAGFRPEKGRFLLVKAADIILREKPEVTFLLVGKGELEPAVRGEVQAQQLGGNVVFAGYRSDIPRLLQASDLFVLSSDYEGMPVSLLEAMAAGVPVVSTAVGGIPEVVTDGVHGLLVHPGAPQELAQKVLTLLGDEDLRHGMGKAGARLISQKFEVQRMVSQTEELYRELLVNPVG